MLIALRSMFCLVIMVAVLEICARFDDMVSYGAPFWGSYNDESLYTTDAAGKWGKPNARYERWQLNSLGYRGPELRNGTIRIVCFGASETFGLYEAPDEEYPRQLERDLNRLANGPYFQVVNAAYAGESLTAAIRHVPRVVSQVSPSYALIYPSLAAYISIAGRSSGPTTHATTLADWVEKLRIVSRLHNVLKRALPRAVQTKLQELQIKREAASIPVIERVPQENVERFREDLRALVGALRSYEVEPVLVTHATAFGPTPSSGNRRLLIAWRKFYPMLKEDGFIDMEQRMNDVIRNTAVQQGVLLVDAANEIPPRPEYFADFVHFTTAGAAVMAGKLADALKPIVFVRLQRETPVTWADPSPSSKDSASNVQTAVGNR